MENYLNDFARCLAFENGISDEAASGLVKWMENEGVLDYAVIAETYAEPRPTFVGITEDLPGGIAFEGVRNVLKVANDA